MSEYHIPVLLKEAVEGLNIREGGIYVDATFGGGGHSREILRRLKGGKLFGFDKDHDAKQNSPSDSRFELIGEDFRHMRRFLRLQGINKVDGILADLGVSSHQFDIAERGFSLRFEGPLDMRMDQGQELSAAHFLNHTNEEELSQCLKVYGEIRSYRKIARAILAQRPIESTSHLVNILKEEGLGQAKHQAQVFQAIRIQVNNELDALIAMLESSTGLIKEGGRLSVISYHSLEDRLVKRFIQSGNVQGTIQKDFFGNIERPWKKINTKPITPSSVELSTNPRSRSAKLRIAQKQ